jgi:hypothetical protein
MVLGRARTGWVNGRSGHATAHLTRPDRLVSCSAGYRGLEHAQNLGRFDRVNRSRANHRENEQLQVHQALGCGDRASGFGLHGVPLTHHRLKRFFDVATKAALVSLFGLT